ncbi:MAG: DNA-3-methyladenine glycosylase 2 [Smithella sp.]|nr:DNA-3-methyladenine glycosylase 2 [Smithella sp.]
MEQRKLTIPAVEPFKLEFTIWALRRRKTNIVDWWDEERYSRVLVFDDQPVRMIITQEGTNRAPNLGLTLISQKGLSLSTQTEALLIVGKMLGLTIDLHPFYKHAARNKFLRDLVRVFRGVKPPCFPSLFEALVNSISCQQVSLDVGILMMNRLAKRFGVKFEIDGLVQYAFPRTEDLENATEADIKDLGYSAQKARSIKELAQTFPRHDTTSNCLTKLDNEQIVQFLTTFRGIGRWSAQYTLLRGLGRLDIFPGDDVGAKNNLQRLFHLAEKPDYEEINKLTSPWHPYEGLVYYHLLLEKLNRNGVI